MLRTHTNTALEVDDEDNGNGMSYRQIFKTAGQGKARGSVSYAHF